jgi:hypothetical protein
MTLADVGISPAEVRWRKRFAPRPAPAAPAPRPRVFNAPAELAERLVADGLVATSPADANSTASTPGVRAGGEGSG